MIAPLLPDMRVASVATPARGAEGAPGAFAAMFALGDVAGGDDGSGVGGAGAAADPAMPEDASGWPLPLAPMAAGASPVLAPPGGDAGARAEVAPDRPAGLALPDAAAQALAVALTAAPPPVLALRASLPAVDPAPERPMPAGESPRVAVRTGDRGAVDVKEARATVPLRASGDPLPRGPAMAQGAGASWAEERTPSMPPGPSDLRPTATADLPRPALVTGVMQSDAAASQADPGAAPHPPAPGRWRGAEPPDVIPVAKGEHAAASGDAPRPRPVPVPAVPAADPGRLTDAPVAAGPALQGADTARGTSADPGERAAMPAEPPAKALPVPDDSAPGDAHARPKPPRDGLTAPPPAVAGGGIAAGADRAPPAPVTDPPAPTAALWTPPPGDPVPPIPGRAADARPGLSALSAAPEGADGAGARDAAVPVPQAPALPPAALAVDLVVPQADPGGMVAADGADGLPLAQAPASTSAAPPSPPVAAPAPAPLPQPAAPPVQGPTEFAIGSPDLGEVRLRLVTDGPAMQLLFLAERPDTLDLMRRNADLLMADLRALGLGQAALDFAGGGGAQGHSRAAPPEPPAPGRPPEAPADLRRPPPPSPNTAALNLRL